jgi:hypothetical protein
LEKRKLSFSAYKHVGFPFRRHFCQKSIYSNRDLLNRDLILLWRICSEKARVKTQNLWEALRKPRLCFSEIVPKYSVPGYGAMARTGERTGFFG